MSPFLGHLSSLVGGPVFGVHPTLIHTWKKHLLAGADQVFSNGARSAAGDAEAQKAELFEQIGRLKMELEWLKKKVGPIA